MCVHMCAYMCVLVCGGGASVYMHIGHRTMTFIMEGSEFLRRWGWIWSGCDFLCCCKETSRRSQTPEQNIDQSCWKINNVPCWSLSRNRQYSVAVRYSLNEDWWEGRQLNNYQTRVMCTTVHNAERALSWETNCLRSSLCSLFSRCAWAGYFPLWTSVFHCMELSWELSDSILGKFLEYCLTHRKHPLNISCSCRYFSKSSFVCYQLWSSK